MLILADSKQEGGKESEKRLKAIAREISTLDKRVAEKEKALSANEDPEQLQLRKRYGELEDLLRRLKTDVPYKEQSVSEATYDRDQSWEQVADVDRRVEDIGGQVHATRNRLQNLEGQSTDRLSAFGTKMGLVLDAMSKRRWVGARPIGPLGMHVRLEDARYTDAIQSMLGANMCSFAVHDRRDQGTMMQLLKDCAKKQVTR